MPTISQGKFKPSSEFGESFRESKTMLQLMSQRQKESEFQRNQLASILEAETARCRHTQPALTNQPAQAAAAPGSRRQCPTASHRGVDLLGLAFCSTGAPQEDSWRRISSYRPMDQGIENTRSRFRGAGGVTVTPRFVNGNGLIPFSFHSSPFLNPKFL